LPLLREDWGIDWPAGAVPMTGRAWRNIPGRIAEFYQLDDRLRRPERVWIRIAHRLARIIGRDIGNGIFVKCLGDIGHELIGSAAGVVIIELFVNRSAGLAGKVWKFW